MHDGGVLRVTWTEDHVKYRLRTLRSQFLIFFQPKCVHYQYYKNAPNAWWGGWVWHMDWGPPLSSFARRTLKQETGVCFIWHPEYLNRNIEIPNVSRWVKLRGSLVQGKYHIPHFDISLKCSTSPLSHSILQSFCTVAYLCAAYLCICVPVNSQFKYLSNIPSQYRATCQTLSIRNRHKLSAFFANSRSPTYDKEARSEVGWVFCENTAGKQFCHPAQFC